MKCTTCGETEIIKINGPDRVTLECKNGHIWFEDYIDQGGEYERHSSYKVTIDNLLFEEQKENYEKIILELESNEDFYKHADPLQATIAIMKNCNLSEADLYAIMRKVAKYCNLSDY